MLPEVLYAPTDDGWQLALHYLSARDASRRHPVLMVHGLATNRINLDLDERHSVARTVRAHGFDVYVLELRGAGLSRPPGGRDRSMFQWGFGEYLRRDLPAAVRRVLEHAGASQLHGFGHSMGGMVLFGLAVNQPPELRSLTAVGSPLLAELHLRTRERRLLEVAAKLAPAATQGHVPLKPLLGAAGLFVSLSARLADGVLLNNANCDAQVLGRFARDGIHDIPVKLLTEMAEQMQNGHCEEGPYAYESRLHRVSAPVSAVGGSVDRVAPASSVAALVSRLRVPDLRHREMGTDHGDRADYGHADLLVGRAAPEEVFPQLVDFLVEMD